MLSRKVCVWGIECSANGKQYTECHTENWPRRQDSPENLVLEAGAHSKKQQIAAGTLEKIVERMTSQKTASPDLVCVCVCVCFPPF